MTLRSALRLLFWAALAAAFVLACLPHPPQLPVETSDKVQHFAAFAGLAMLGRLAYPTVALFRVALGLAFFGALIEAAQAIPQLHRSSELADWMADAGGIAVGLLAIRLALRLRG